jgi:hypothetical protein
VKAEHGLVRRAGLAAAVVAALLTSACAAGQHAQSAAEQGSVDGTKAQVGQVTLGALAIESPDNGIAYERGSNARVKVVIVNSGQRADTLTSITSPAITGWGAFANASDASAYAAAQAAAGAPSSDSAAPSAPSSDSAAPSGSTGPQPQKSIEIAAHSRVQFGTDQVEGGTPNRVLVLNGLKTTLHSGMTISVTFTFERAGTVTAQVPVQLSKEAQTSVIPGPSATGEVG